MANHTVITLVCDNCGTEESPERPVRRHRAKVDRGDIVNVDACDPCWHAVHDAFAALLTKGQAEPGTSRWRL